MLGTLVFAALAVVASWGVVYCAVLLLLAGAVNCGPDSLLTGSVTMMIGEKYGRNNGAGVTSLANGLGSIGGIIEGPIVGLVSQYVGWTGVILLMVVMSFFATLASLKAHLIVMREDKKRRKRKEEERSKTVAAANTKQNKEEEDIPLMQQDHVVEVV